MATLKEFEEALRDAGMTNALAVLDELKKRDRTRRAMAPARRVVGKKMTADLARTILDLHARTAMTQQEIAFKLGVNQGRVNEVVKRGKWLSADPKAPEVLSRDQAMARLAERAKARRAPAIASAPLSASPSVPAPRASGSRASSAKLPPPPKASLVRPTAVLRQAPQPARLASPPKPRIISAQLAFLDL